MKIKKIWPGFTLTVLSLVILTTSCNDPSETTDLLGDWLRKSSFDGVTRSGAVSFTIGTRVFAGTGYDGTKRLKDFWEFDAAKNTWIKRAELPGVARNSAVAFTVNGKGYVGTGLDGVNRLNDFWEYTPGPAGSTVDNGTWTQIANFPADAPYRYGAVALSLSNKGYVGAGYGGDAATGGGNNLKDWWSYNGTTWNRESSIGGDKRLNAFAFVISGVGYVGGGNNNNTYPYDFWKFDGTNWTELNGLDDIDDSDFTYRLQRESAVTFTIGNSGYLVTGSENSSTLKTCWEYNPSTDSWTQKTDFEGAPRDGAIGFSVGTKGYVTTGRNGTTRFDDIWEFDPTLEKVE